MHKTLTGLAMACVLVGCGSTATETVETNNAVTNNPAKSSTGPSGPTHTVAFKIPGMT